MKIMLNREDIEEAIREYVSNKYYLYGTGSKMTITQSMKATATITFSATQSALPGMDESEEDDLEV